VTVVNVNVADAVPEAAVAVSVYVVAAMTSVGVPESKPVEVLSDTPAGKVPDKVNDVNGPPRLLMLYVFAVVAAVAVSSVNEVLVKVIRGDSFVAVNGVNVSVTVPAEVVVIARSPVLLEEVVTSVKDESLATV